MVFKTTCAPCTLSSNTWYSLVVTIHCLSVISRVLYLWAKRVKLLVQPTGIEPVSMALQTTAMTTSARVAWGVVRVPTSCYNFHRVECFHYTNDTISEHIFVPCLDTLILEVNSNTLDYGASSRTRTYNLSVKSRLLYHWVMDAWQGIQESNLYYLSQSQVCYHYTNPQQNPKFLKNRSRSYLMLTLLSTP